MKKLLCWLIVIFTMAVNLVAAQVTFKLNPTADAGPDLWAYNGDVVSVGTNGVAGNSYVWTEAGVVVANTAEYSTVISNTTLDLAVTNINGCVKADQVALGLKSFGDPSADLDDNQGKMICSGAADSFAIVLSGTNPPWDLTIKEKYTDGTATKQYTVTGITSTTYWVKISPVRDVTYSVISVTDAIAASNPGIGYVTYTVATPPAFNALGVDKMVCAGVDQTFVCPAGFDSWLWSTGEVTSSIKITPSVNMSVNLTARSTIAPNCIVKDTVNLAVFAKPTVSFATDSINICQGSTHTMSPIVSADVVKYTWSPAPGLSNTTIPNPVCNASQTYTLKVENGLCNATAQQVVSVNPNPIVTVAGISQPICEGTTSTINVVSDVPGTKFTFYPGTGLSDPNNANPTVTLDTTTQYTIEAITPMACKNFKAITVNITKKPIADFGFQVFGGRVVFTDLSMYADSKFYNWDFGDADTTASTQVNPIHDYTVNGSKFNVWLTVANSCGNSTKNKLVSGVKVGLDELIQGTISLYPNPVVDYIIIEGIQKVSVIQVLSTNGSLLYNEKFINEESVTLSVSNFAYGEYLVRFILNDGSSFSKKFVKQ